MGWLFACFGYTKKRKRPKKASKFGPQCRKIRSYQPLQPDVPDEPHGSQPLSLSCSDLGPREEPKEENKASIRKRVRFNLEVTTYELLPAADDDAITNSLDYGGDNCSEKRKEDKEEDEQATPKVFIGYAPLAKPSYASNHRYSNCYDDEDEYHDDDDDDDNDLEDKLSDLDDDEDGEEEEEYESRLIDANKIYCKEITEDDHIISVPLRSSDDGELVTINGSKQNARFRSHYVVPVLNPIENLSQWKAVKSRKC